MIGIIQEDVGAPRTNQMLLQLCLFQKRACVCLLALGEAQPLEAITFPRGKHGILPDLNLYELFFRSLLKVYSILICSTIMLTSTLKFSTVTAANY